MAAKKTGAKVKKEKAVPERVEAENIEEIIVELAKQGNTPAKIGQILKEKYWMHKVKTFGKKITKILKEKGVSFKKDIDFVKEKIKKIEAHKSKNKQDKRAKIELTRMIHLKKKMDAYLLKKQN